MGCLFFRVFRFAAVWVVGCLPDTSVSLCTDEGRLWLKSLEKLLILKVLATNKNFWANEKRQNIKEWKIFQISCEFLTFERNVDWHLLKNSACSLLMQSCLIFQFTVKSVVPQAKNKVIFWLLNDAVRRFQIDSNASDYFRERMLWN